MSRRIIETGFIEEDNKIEGSLRPQYLKDYIGQEKAKEIFFFTGLPDLVRQPLQE